MRRTRSIVVAMEREDVYKGPLILVNPHHPIRVAMGEGCLTQLAPGIRLEKQAARLYEAVIYEIGAASRIVPVSGYRPRAEQERLYAETLAERGEEYTATFVALPGCSEHETGLALDVAERADSIDFITPSFPYAGICQRFREAAARHGFIQRYPEGKRHITHIGHEPWHFRYVGMPHAGLMHRHGLTLEEYAQWLRTLPWHTRPHRFTLRGHSFAVGHVPAGDGATEIALPGEPYTISGDNVDGFVVAVWGCEA